jgi:L-serine dehydratase
LYGSFEELRRAAGPSGSIGKAVAEREVTETGRTLEIIRGEMAEALQVMREAVAEGLTGRARSRSGLVGGDAARMAGSSAGPLTGVVPTAVAYALAVGEVNASMGRIVAAPTGGASGVLPGVVLAVAETCGATDDDLVDALLTASGIGGVIASRATLSGAAGGCQAEIGSAAAMAAGAAAALCGGSPDEVGHAASLALQGLLGLVCDPIGGLVEVPCVARNGTAAAMALAAAHMALAGVTFPIPFDEVADAMAHVGRSLPPTLRETALGGLAATSTGRELAQNASRASERLAPEPEDG